MAQQEPTSCNEWLRILELKHLLFASEIEPEGTKRLLQHLATTQGLMMEPVWQTIVGRESETQT